MDRKTFHQISQLIRTNQYMAAADLIDANIDDATDLQYDALQQMVMDVTDTNGYGILLDALGGEDDNDD